MPKKGKKIQFQKFKKIKERKKIFFSYFWSLIQISMTFSSFLNERNIHGEISFASEKD